MSPLTAFRRRVPAPDGMSWPHVVIIGGGFAGANAALELKDARVRVTLIDRNIYKTFQPLLYQVATGGLNPGDVTMVLCGLSRHAFEWTEGCSGFLGGSSCRWYVPCIFRCML